MWRTINEEVDKMKTKIYEIEGVMLNVGEKFATIFVEGAAFTAITFKKELLDKYAESYIVDNFKMSEDGWVRKVEEDEKETSL